MRRSIPAVLLSIAPLFAQQSGSLSSDDHQLVLQLLQRVNELEAEVRRLKGQAPAAIVPAAPPVQTAQAPAQAGAPVTPPNPGATPDTQMGGMHDMALPFIPGLQFRGFSDVGFADSDQRGAHSTFSTGAFNMFMTSRLSDKFSVLAELIFEFDPTNAVHTDLERMEFHYNPSDFLNLTAGRFHTSIGYYNTAYHHASWLYNTVNRPFLFAFEDQGGILPTHNVGLSATGAIPSGALGLHYIAEIGNGRTSHSVLDAVAEPVQVAQDENSRKSVNFAAFSRPAAIPGFQTGFSIYADRLYPTGGPKIAETIWDGYVTYHPSGFEFTGETVMLRHALEGTNIIYHIPGFYATLAKNIGGGVRPYFSWEYLNVAHNEPLWGTAIGMRHGPSTGIRYDFSDFAAFKLEYYRLFRRGQNDVNGIRSQLTFTF
ncbi:conserved exported hypothetical protein [Candidatus Sulfopaludibacter sp. SbA3]|nr:conserved exported hypothetical protein [Candidatus Sulfopaludibacter sp. SbA3]